MNLFRNHLETIHFPAHICLSRPIFLLMEISVLKRGRRSQSPYNLVLISNLGSHTVANRLKRSSQCGCTMQVYGEEYDSGEIKQPAQLCYDGFTQCIYKVYTFYHKFVYGNGACSPLKPNKATQIPDLKHERPVTGCWCLSLDLKDISDVFYYSSHRLCQTRRLTDD